MKIKEVKYCLLDSISTSASTSPTKSPHSTTSSTASTSEDYTKDTIFKVMDERGKQIYLKNMKSSIILGDQYKIRNPPSFMDPLGTWTLVEHPSEGPLSPFI